MSTTASCTLKKAIMYCGLKRSMIGCSHSENALDCTIMWFQLHKHIRQLNPALIYSVFSLCEEQVEASFNHMTLYSMHISIGKPYDTCTALQISWFTFTEELRNTEISKKYCKNKHRPTWHASVGTCYNREQHCSCVT